MESVKKMDRSFNIFELNIIKKTCEWDVDHCASEIKDRVVCWVIPGKCGVYIVAS